MPNLCVFCGAKSASATLIQQHAEQLGRLMAEHGYGLIYGGAKIGLMGVVADAVLSHGGQAIGIIPESMRKQEVVHDQLTELHVVHSMAERKQLMADYADGIIALPGGYGTLDELFESLTNYQLDYVSAPCGVLNSAGYYDALLIFLDHAMAQGLLKERHRSLLWSATEPETLIQQFNEFFYARETHTA